MRPATVTRVACWVWCMRVAASSELFKPHAWWGQCDRAALRRIGARPPTRRARCTAVFRLLPIIPTTEGGRKRARASYLPPPPLLSSPLECGMFVAVDYPRGHQRAAWCLNKRRAARGGWRK